MSHPTVDKLFAAMRSTKGIPAMEGIVSSVLGTLRNEKGNHHTLARYISEDFTLTQKVLRLANSFMYAPFAKDASSVSSAVQILGTDSLLHVVISTAMASEAEIRDDRHLSQTLLASELARSLYPDRSEDLSVAGLMVDLGRLVAARFLPDEMAQVQARIVAGTDPEQAARLVLGMTLPQLGVEVAKRWNLPDSIVGIIDGTGDSTVVQAARLASTASHLILDGKADELAQLTEQLALPGVDKSRLNQLIQRKLDDVGATVLSQPQHIPAGMALETLFHELAAEKWDTPEALAGAMFSSIHHVLKTSHCLLLARDAKGDFVIRAGLGQRVAALRSEFSVSAGFKPTAFHAAIQNNVDIAIDDAAKLRPSALPPDYRRLFPHVTKFVIVPIANPKVTGLIYCDWDADGDYLPTELLALRKLRDLFLPFF